MANNEQMPKSNSQTTVCDLAVNSTAEIAKVAGVSAQNLVLQSIKGAGSVIEVLAGGQNDRNYESINR